MAVTRDLFRAISSSFPTGVVIVATLDEHGEPKGLTSQAYLGLSTEPPLMLVSIDRTSRTLPALEKHRAFVINFLKDAAEDVATLFASKSDDKFKTYVPLEKKERENGDAGKVAPRVRKG